MGYDINRVGECLRGMRARKKLTQHEVAEKTGMSADSLANYENASTGMSLRSAWLLADFYGVTMDELFERTW